MNDFQSTSAPIPLETIEDIRLGIEDTQASNAINKAAIHELQGNVVRLDAGQIEILRRQDEHALALGRNTEVTEQIRDIFTAGKVGSSILAWLGRVWPGLAVIGAGLWLLWTKKWP